MRKLSDTQVWALTRLGMGIMVRKWNHRTKKWAKYYKDLNRTAQFQESTMKALQDKGLAHIRTQDVGLEEMKVARITEKGSLALKAINEGAIT